MLWPTGHTTCTDLYRPFREMPCAEIATRASLILELDKLNSRRDAEIAKMPETLKVKRCVAYLVLAAPPLLRIVTSGLQPDRTM